MDAEHQQHPLRVYFVVWVWLFILSACSYAVDYFHVEGYLRWTLILIFMLLKAGLIVAVFMHMAWERLALVYAIVLPMVAVLVFVAIMTFEVRLHLPDALGVLQPAAVARNRRRPHPGGSAPATKVDVERAGAAVPLVRGRRPRRISPTRGGAASQCGRLWRRMPCRRGAAASSAAALAGDHQHQPQVAGVGGEDEAGERGVGALRGHAVQVEARLRLEPAAPELLEPAAVHARMRPVRRRRGDGDAGRAGTPGRQETRGRAGSGGGGSAAGWPGRSGVVVAATASQSRRSSGDRPRRRRAMRQPVSRRSR